MSTKIQWTDETWNPVTGCDKVSQGCKNCYAERLATGRLKNLPEYQNGFLGNVTMHNNRLPLPLRWRKPRRIFVNSMSDLFHESVSFEFISAVFAVMAACKQHEFQILTKRPERMAEWFKMVGKFPNFEDSLFKYSAEVYLHPQMQKYLYWPEIEWPLPNVWLGVSVENQEMADYRIPHLLETPSCVRFISAEPLLGPIELGEYMDSAYWSGIADPPPGLDWVIAGGESGSKARPVHPAWLQLLRDQCMVTGVPFFFKQWGEWSPADEPIVRQYKNAKKRGYGFFDRADQFYYEAMCGNHQHMIKTGVKGSGRLLDSIEHNEYPQIGDKS